MEKSVKELVEAFSNSLTYGDIIAAEQLAKISTMIFKARIDRGMTQKEFADLIGVSQGMVSKWESEDYNFTVESLAKICEKLDWDLSIDIRPRSKNKFSQFRELPWNKWETTINTVNRNESLEVAS